MAKQQLKISLLVVLLLGRELSTASATDEKSTISVCESLRLSSHLTVTWIIENFTRDYVKDSAPSSSKDSDAFEIPIGPIQTKWILRIYPNGDFRRQGVLSIFLMKTSESSQSYEYSCRFSIMRQDKEVMFAQFNAQLTSSDELGTGRGYLDFLTHERLFKQFHEYVQNSQLTIRADIKLSSPSNEKEIVLKSSVKR